MRMNTFYNFCQCFLCLQSIRIIPVIQLDIPIPFHFSFISQKFGESEVGSFCIANYSLEYSSYHLHILHNLWKHNVNKSVRHFWHMIISQFFVCFRESRATFAQALGCFWIPTKGNTQLFRYSADDRWEKYEASGGRAPFSTLGRPELMGSEHASFGLGLGLLGPFLGPGPGLVVVYRPFYFVLGTDRSSLLYLLFAYIHNHIYLLVDLNIVF